MSRAEGLFNKHVGMFMCSISISFPPAIIYNIEHSSGIPSRRRKTRKKTSPTGPDFHSHVSINQRESIVYLPLARNDCCIGPGKGGVAKGIIFNRFVRLIKAHRSNEFFGTHAHGTTTFAACHLTRWICVKKFDDSGTFRPMMDDDGSHVAFVFTVTRRSS